MENNTNNFKYTVIGAKILVQLDKFPEEVTVTESGIYVPQYKNYETDGGKPAVALQQDLWTTTGTIIQIADKAAQILEEQSSPLEVGQKVLLETSAKITHNWFFPDRTKQIQDWNGLLLVHPNSIQATVHN